MAYNNFKYNENKMRNEILEALLFSSRYLESVCVNSTGDARLPWTCSCHLLTCEWDFVLVTDSFLQSSTSLSLFLFYFLPSSLFLSHFFLSICDPHFTLVRSGSSFSAASQINASASESGIGKIPCWTTACL